MGAEPQEMEGLAWGSFLKTARQRKAVGNGKRRGWDTRQ
jgi:hypothetical protein